MRLRGCRIMFTWDRGHDQVMNNDNDTRLALEWVLVLKFTPGWILFYTIVASDQRGIPSMLLMLLRER